MFWYIVLNGKKLPTPYATYSDLTAAQAELRARLTACVITQVYE